MFHTVTSAVRLSVTCTPRVQDRLHKLLHLQVTLRQATVLDPPAGEAKKFVFTYSTKASAAKQDASVDTSSRGRCFQDRTTAMPCSCTAVCVAVLRCRKRCHAPQNSKCGRLNRRQA